MAKNKTGMSMGRQRKRTTTNQRLIKGKHGNFKDEQVRSLEALVLKTLPESPRDMAFDELVDTVAKQLNPLVFPLRRTVSRYTKVVQLDLERRGLIERVPGVSPIKLRRTVRLSSKTKKS